MSRSEKSANKNRSHSNNKNRANQNTSKNNNRKSSESKRRSLSAEELKAIRENASAIKAFKAAPPICEICSQNIVDQSTAIANKITGNPVHFDCVLKKLSENEKIETNERFTYIGQGRFAVLRFENPRNTRRFKIIKIIEWESREQKRGQWRDTMAELFSHVR